jgi:sulfide:quinone oxidoreductase
LKTLLILGAGTGGTIIANKMKSMLDKNEWKIVMVDRDENHYYQPGFLFVPFGVYKPSDIVKPKKDFIPAGAELIISEIELIEPDANQVRLGNGQVIHYDELVIATGAYIHPEETEGLMGEGWRKNIFDFYTPDGSAALGKFLETWKGGRLVMNVVENPIKCPVAPLEFLFLADWFFTKKGMRDKVELVYATPLEGAFTKPKAAAALGSMLEKKGIKIEPVFNVSEVDSANNVIKSYDEREIQYDLLVTIPTNMGSTVIDKSGMGDELGFVPVDKHTLQSSKWENVWVIGDGGTAPASKAGSVAHFMNDILAENIHSHINGKKPEAQFDGHANCYIESGFNKALLIDFNYDTEPLTGTFPMPMVGPFSLLKESFLNHIGKLSFRWIYWNMLLKAIPIPTVNSHMSMAGKQKIN